MKQPMVEGPQFHVLQIWTATIIMVIAMFIYTFGPEDRVQLFHDITYVCLAFLFGKYTNGFARYKPTRWNDSVEAKNDGQTVNGLSAGDDTKPE